MFYVYVWMRVNGEPYYVGKGKGNRAYTSVGHTVKCPSKERIVVYPSISEADAFETEVALIWYYGRKDLGLGCLRNLTDGGQGMSGHRYSIESRKKISDAHVGMQPSCASVRNNRNSHIGKKHTDETRRKMSIAKLGNKNSPGWPKGKPRKEAQNV